MNIRSQLFTILTVATATVVTAPLAQAVSLFGLTDNNTLVRFDSASPGSTTSVQVTGIGDGFLQGIDFRPANRLLYGLTDTNKIYTINSKTGAATFVSTLSTTFDGGFQSGVDFNPAADRLRVVGSNDQNLRFNADTGALGDFDLTTPATVEPDLNLAYAAGDTNFGKNPNITAAAYTQSFPGPPSPLPPATPTRTTQLYGIDYALDVLVLQNPPNDGALTTIGSLGVNFAPTGGFDIFTNANKVDTAYALSGSTLYDINLSTGAATSLGAVGSSGGYIGLAAKPVPEPSSVLGALAFGAFGAGWMLKRKKQQAA